MKTFISMIGFLFEPHGIAGEASRKDDPSPNCSTKTDPKRSNQMDCVIGGVLYCLGKDNCTDDRIEETLGKTKSAASSDGLN